MEKVLYFIIMFIITTYLSSNRFRPHILYRNFKRKWILKKTYVARDKIVYGVPHYDFFDHESRAYLSYLISIECKDKNLYAYDFNLTFEENSKVFPKIQEIKSFLENNPDFDKLCIDEIIKEKLSSRISNDYREVVIIDKVFKSRKDEKSEMEAGILKIELIRTNLKTLSLIEELYKYLVEINPEALEVNFKTNNTKYIQERDRYDILCFLTKVKINGFILNVKEESVEFVVCENSIFSFSIDIDNEKVCRYAKNGKIGGEIMKRIVEDYIDKFYRLNKSGKTKFTDVAISYLDGVNLELMGCTIFDDINLSGLNKVEITDNYEKFRKMTDKEDGLYKKEFAYLYMWSLNRKIRHNHL